MQPSELTLRPITIEDLFTKYQGEITLGEDILQAVQRCRDFLDGYLKDNDRPVYGINTGFGSLCNTRISNDELEDLQRNLVRSHACGTGETIDPKLVRTMILLKIKGLGKGFSGIHPNTLELLTTFYNHHLIPVVYEYGSLGASGDLAPLAHMSLPLMGEGEFWQNGSIEAAEDVWKKLTDIKPVTLKSKEGLALLNGTQFIQAHLAWIVYESQQLLTWANFLASASLIAFSGLKEPFAPGIHKVRGHEGAIHCAGEIRNWLVGYDPPADASHVQDPYSFRCVPQVHGAIYQSLKHAREVINTEINAVTDNPTIFPESNEIISGGNFHAEPLALIADQLKMALTELSSISERRVFKLVSGQRGLPPFLSENPGTNSGLMIPQYTAASLVSSNKQLSTPASVDTIDSSNGQEDHVSMGANASRQLWKIKENLSRVLAIELLNVSQAIQIKKASVPVQMDKVLKNFQETVPYISKDRTFYQDIRKAEQFLSNCDPKGL